MTALRWLLLVLFCWVAGCNPGPPRVKVTGMVRLNGDVLANAIVTFHPTGKTPLSSPVGAVTDKNGQYELNGLVEGEYKVVISKRLGPDGTSPPPGEAPMDSDASESLPAEYSDLEKTKLTAKVAEKNRPFDYGLRAPRP